MANDLTGQNIQDTYQRVLQKSSSGEIADGTGSLYIPPTASFAVSASYAHSSSYEIEYEVSSSYAQTSSYSNHLYGSPNISVNQITASGNISSSGNVYASNIILHPSSSNNTGFIRPSVEGSRVVISPYNHGSEELLVIKANALEVKMDAFIAFMVNTSFAGHFNYGHKDLDFQYDYSDSTAGFIINNGDKTIYMSGSGLELGRGMHLTASGDISASGEIIGTINGGSF